MKLWYSSGTKISTIYHRYILYRKALTRYIIVIYWRRENSVNIVTKSSIYQLEAINCWFSQRAPISLIRSKPTPAFNFLHPLLQAPSPNQSERAPSQSELPLIFCSSKNAFQLFASKETRTSYYNICLPLGKLCPL